MKTEAVHFQREAQAYFGTEVHSFSHSLQKTE